MVVGGGGFVSGASFIKKREKNRKGCFSFQSALSLVVPHNISSYKKNCPTVSVFLPLHYFYMQKSYYK